MYLDFFGLDEAPFSITPDPSFIYLSDRHREALAHLLYGVGQGGSGGFVQLTGEVGTGKTTLCRALLDQVPEGTHIALVLNPLMGPVEMLAAICEELGVPTAGIEDGPKLLVDRLNGFLLDAYQAGERVVLVIDEAQNLSIEALEQVRLLTNLETSKHKLLQIILLGQPELRDLLRRRSLRQLAQRITARYHLTPLGPEDTARYVGHRLAVAGAARDPFTRSGHRALFQRSQGVPRLINIIADRALVAGFAAESERIDRRLVQAAANEVQLGEPGVGAPRWQRPVAATAAAALVLFGAWGIWTVLRDRGPAPAAPTELATSGMPAESSSASATPPQGVVASDIAAADESVADGVAVTPPVMDAPADELAQETPAEASSLAVDGRNNEGAESLAAEGIGTLPEAGAPAMAAPSTPVETMAPAVPEAYWYENQDLRAWSGLAAAWGTPQDGALIEASCQGREGLGYACLSTQGNWVLIRKLGLPVVLVLRGDHPGHLLLSGFDGDQLIVGAGSSMDQVDRSVIEPLWYGNFLIAWPQATDWPREIGLGDSGEAVERVLSLATRTDQPYAGPVEFGPDFEQWLMAFQQRNGLEPDGIVGPETLLYLMRFSIEEPRLLTAVETGG